MSWQDKALAARDKAMQNYDNQRKGAEPSASPVRDSTAPMPVKSGLPTREGSKKQPRILEPYRPFPVDALPEMVREFVRQTSAAIGCDDAYVALPVLSVLASAIGNTRTIRLKRGWEEPSVVWSTTVGDSGTLKSPPYQKAVGPLFRLQRRLMREHQQSMTHYETELARFEVSKGRGKDKSLVQNKQPEEPVMRRVICSDTTIEKLAEMLEDNPRGILVARDELAAWLASFCRYKGKAGGTDLPNWLEMFRAGPLIVDRKTGERRNIYIPRAAVSITGSVQHGVLARALSPEHLEAGLGARLLLCMPPKTPKRWTELEVDPDIEAAYEDIVSKLLSLEFHFDSHGEEIPHVLKMSPEAKCVWVRFYELWAKEQAAVEGELAAAFSKLEAYAARFTLIDHVVRCVARGVDDLVDIQKESIEAGIKLCRWFAHETRRIYATLSETSEERDTRRLVEFIRARGGSITARDLQRSNDRKYRTASLAELALDSLVSAGLAHWEERPAQAKGGRPPTPVLKLLPTPDDTDKTTNPNHDLEESKDLDPSDKTPDIIPGKYQNASDSDVLSGFVGCRTRTGEMLNGAKVLPESQPDIVAESGIMSDSSDEMLQDKPDSDDNEVTEWMG